LGQSSSDDSVVPVGPERRDGQEVLHADLALETEGLLDVPELLRVRLERRQVRERGLPVARRLHRHADRHAASAEAAAQHLLDLGLVADERVGQALLDREEAVVHRTHLDVNVHPAVSLGGAAESGHAVHLSAGADEHIGRRIAQSGALRGLGQVLHLLLELALARRCADVLGASLFVQLIQKARTRNDTARKTVNLLMCWWALVPKNESLPMPPNAAAMPPSWTGVMTTMKISRMQMMMKKMLRQRAQESSGRAEARS
jgi:hypothetical protein